MSIVRAFLAVPLPLSLQEAISIFQKNLKTQIPQVRWTRPENLHLTLHFFGNTTQENLEKIKVSVLSVKSCQRPFPVDVKGLGAFPSRHRPRVIWLDIEPKEQLRQLHSQYLGALLATGIATEPRPYSPHLTIGRLYRQKPDLTDLCHAVSTTLVGKLPVDRLVLFESRLHHGAAEHIPLMTVLLENKLSTP